MTQEPYNRHDTNRTLMETYWMLQRNMHTNPGLRPYVHALDRHMRNRGISPSYLNGVGLEMEAKGNL